MLKTIEASEVRTHLSEIMMEAYKNSTRFVLESDKTPMAVVIGYQDYLQLLEDQEDIEAMLEVAAAYESEKIDYDEYRKRRLSMEGAGTSQVKISRLTVKGQMTLPKEYQKKLSVGPGDYVALLEVDEGILIKKANILTETHAEKTLRETALAFGKAAKKRGLTEEQLEQEIKDDLEEIRSEMYKEQYCG
jgi:AbrB family looped-hinge helix DNA binding protein